MSKIISPSLDPRDGGIQMLAKMYNDLGIANNISHPLVMNWKYAYKVLPRQYDLVVHGLEFFPTSIMQKAALNILLKIKPPRRIIYVSNFTKSRIEEKYKALSSVPNRVIYNPIPYDSSSTLIDRKNRNKIILTVCRAVKRKNLENAFEAYLKSNLFSTGWTYYYIGSGPLEDALKEKYPQINFLGNVSEAEKKDWLQKSDIFLHPQVALGEDFEGFGIAPVEAMQHTTVPIIGEQCGLREVMPQWDYFTDGTLESIVEQLNTVSIDLEDAKIKTINCYNKINKILDRETFSIKLREFLC